MTVAKEHVQAKIARAEARVAQLRAQVALREMRKASVAQAKARRLHAKRRQELGEAVAEAGLENWSKAELTGLLLRAKDEFGGSDLTRKMLGAHATFVAGGPGQSSIH